MIANFREGGFGGRDRGRGGFGSRPRFGGGGGFGGRDRGRSFNGHRDSRPREMFDATCSKCGKACRVPFKPTGEKPVLCSDCFGEKDLRNGNNFSSRQNSGDSKQLDQINAKLDKIIGILKELELDTGEDYEDVELSDEEAEDSEEPSHEVVITATTDDAEDEEF